VEAIIDELTLRHRGIAAELGIDPAAIAAPLEELRHCAKGMELLAEDSLRARDRLLACGELLMAPLFAAHLRTRGLDAVGCSAADLGLLTDDRHGRARPLPECYASLAAGLAAFEGVVPVVTGFIGATRDGRVTTLGRGGSDYSAAIVARAIGARELQIWTDVDGIRTADPRIVPEARRIDHLTFREASELAYSGAKVLHPQTIAPAMELGIPVQVRDTRHPDLPGTSITAKLPPGVDANRVRAIAHRGGVRVITVVSPRMLARHGFLSRIAEVFDRHSLSIDMISTSEVSISLTPDDPNVDLAPLVADLEKFAEVQLVEGRGMVSVVGDRLDRDGKVVAEILTGVAALGAPIQMISYGATRTNLTFLIPDAQLPDVVRALHARYFG
jgi:aspartate kinase